MSKREDYSLQDFIEKSEKLLGDIGAVEELTLDLPSESTEKIGSEIRRRTFESMEKAAEIQSNGYAEVRISEDEMQATADFFPPTGGMDAIELDHVEELLQARGITTGVDREVIKEAVFRCNTERTQVTDVVIARGRSPVAKVPEHLKIEERF